jgi:hypothetical protein
MKLKNKIIFLKTKKKQPKSTWEDSLNPWFRLWDWDYLIEENKITKIISQLIKIERIKLEKKNYVEKDEKMTLANPDQLEKLMKWVMRLGLFHRRQIKKITKLNSQQTKY